MKKNKIVLKVPFKLLNDIYEKTFYKDLISLKESKYLNIIKHKNKS